MAAIACWSAPAPDQKLVQLPELSVKRLMNDLQVIVAAAPNLGEAMTIGLVVRYGASFDPAGKGGLANLTSRLLMKATADRTLKDIQDEMAYLGATIEVQCDWDGFRFILRGQSSKYERSLLLLYQIVCEPQFNEADLLAVRQDILQGIQKPPDPRQRIRSQLEDILFSGTTYGRPLEGTQSSLKAITLGDVRHFHRKHFSPGDAALLIVGDVPAPQVIQKVSRIWGVWVRNDQIPFTFTPPKKPAGRNVFLEDDPGSPAAQFILGNTFARREEPVYCSAMLAARILQERLTKLLPTSLLTVGSDGRRMASLFYIQGQAAADQAVDQIQKIHGAVEEMKEAKVAPEELAAAQDRWIEEFNRELGTADGICRIILEAELYRLGMNYAAVFPDVIRRCDADAIKEAARDWFFPAGKFSCFAALPLC